jgi:hypothetical protein
LAEELSNAIQKSDDLRSALKASPSIEILEGLPHPQAFPTEFEQELAEHETIEVAKYKFYAPAVPAREVQPLVKLLSSPKLLGEYAGGGFCGGFHPDYAVKWLKADGQPVYALVGFGCFEILFVDGERKLLYSLRDSDQLLKAELHKYDKKRPPTPQFF